MPFPVRQFLGLVNVTGVPAPTAGDGRQGGPWLSDDGSAASRSLPWWPGWPWACSAGLGDRLPADTVLHVVIALANAAGPWLVTAFVVGALAGAPLAGAITATAALVAAVAVYYLTVYLFGNTVADLPRSPACGWRCRWSSGRCLVRREGAWARPRRPFDRIGAVALLAGTLAAEAILRLIQVEAWTGLDLARTDIQVGLIELAAAAVIPAVFSPRRTAARLPGHGGRDRRATVLTAGALAGIHWALFG